MSQPSPPLPIGVRVKQAKSHECLKLATGIVDKLPPAELPAVRFCNNLGLEALRNLVGSFSTRNGAALPLGFCGGESCCPSVHVWRNDRT